MTPNRLKATMLPPPNRKLLEGYKILKVFTCFGFEKPQALRVNMFKKILEGRR